MFWWQYRISCIEVFLKSLQRLRRSKIFGDDVNHWSMKTSRNPSSLSVPMCVPAHIVDCWRLSREAKLFPCRHQKAKKAKLESTDGVHLSKLKIYIVPSRIESGRVNMQMNVTCNNVRNQSRNSVQRNPFQHRTSKTRKFPQVENSAISILIMHGLWILINKALNSCRQEKDSCNAEFAVQQNHVKALLI